MTRDLLGDRGDQLDATEHQAMLGGGYEQLLGHNGEWKGDESQATTTEGYTDEQLGLMPDPENEALDPTDDEGFPVEPQQTQPEQQEEEEGGDEPTEVEIEGFGKVSVSDLRQALSDQRAAAAAQESSHNLENEYAALKAEMEALRPFQSYMKYPGLREAVNNALADAMKDPRNLAAPDGQVGQFGQQFRDPRIDQIIPTIEKFNEIATEFETQQGIAIIDGVHQEMRNQFGDQWDPKMAKEAEMLAYNRFQGKDPGADEFRGVAFELAVTKGLNRNASQSETTRAMRTQRATRVATGNSTRRAVSTGRINPLKLSDEQVSRLAEQAITGGAIPEV